MKIKRDLFLEAPPTIKSDIDRDIYSLASIFFILWTGKKPTANFDQTITTTPALPTLQTFLPPSEVHACAIKLVLDCRQIDRNDAPKTVVEFLESISTIC